MTVDQSFLIFSPSAFLYNLVLVSSSLKAVDLLRFPVDYCSSFFSFFDYIWFIFFSLQFHLAFLLSPEIFYMILSRWITVLCFSVWYFVRFCLSIVFYSIVSVSCAVLLFSRALQICSSISFPFRFSYFLYFFQLSLFSCVSKVLVLMHVLCLVMFVYNGVQVYLTFCSRLVSLLSFCCHILNQRFYHCSFTILRSRYSIVF